MICPPIPDVLEAAADSIRFECTCARFTLHGMPVKEIVGLKRRLSLMRDSVHAVNTAALVRELTIVIGLCDNKITEAES